MSEFKNEWITKGLNRSAIDYCNAMGKELVDNKFTTTQFRNIFGEIKRIKAKGIENQNQIQSFLLLKPKVAYAAVRDGKEGSKVFKGEFDKMWDAVFDGEHPTADRFKNFCDLVEGILAFHKN